MDAVECSFERQRKMFSPPCNSPKKTKTIRREKNFILNLCFKTSCLYQINNWVELKGYKFLFMYSNF